MICEFSTSFFIQSALADETFTAPSKNAKRPLTIGAGITYEDKPYKNYDSDEKYQPIPIILYEGEHFFARRQTIGWKVIQIQMFGS